MTSGEIRLVSGDAMKSNYPACIKITLMWEIGPGREHANTDTFGDRRTRDGVTQPVYSRYRRSKGLSFADVWSMADGERDEIYKRQYWDAIGGDRLSAGLDLLAFDCCVNGSHIQNWLWQTEGSPPEARIKKIDGLRRGYWRHCPTFVTNRLGWFRREDDILKHALAMASA